MSGFSEAEREAMKQRATELRATKGLRGAAKLARDLEACAKAIDDLTGLDKDAATLLHRVVGEEAPQLQPKTWYGFPTYALDGDNVVYYQPTSKFGARYGMVSFEEHARLDDGPMWPVHYAVVEVNDEVEERLRELVRRAVG